MRFCPFCAQENPDESRECVHCGKRLPAARTAPPRPAPPVREKPVVAPKPMARSAPRSLPLPPAEPPAVAAPPSEAAPPVVTAPPVTPPPAVTARPVTPPPAVTPPPVAAAPAPVVPKLTLLGIGGNGEVDDFPTAPSPLVEPSELANAEEPATSPDLPDLSSLAQAAQRSRDDSLTLPKPRKTTVTRLESATRPADRVPAPVTAPPSLLAPAPVVAPPPATRAPVASLAPLDSTPPPLLELSHTPNLPTLALPPMPVGLAAPSIIGSVKYLLPLARAVLARKRAQRVINQLLHSDQHLLDQVLRDLGRAARGNDLDVPAVSEEMRRVRAEEQRRAKAEADLAKAADDSGREGARWNGDEAERKTEIARREVELKDAEDDLRAKGEERRGHEVERVRLDGLIRVAEKRAAQTQQQAVKAEATPPEKGGGANTAANLRRQAEGAQKEAAGLATPRDQARAQAEGLDAPIAALTQKIVELRSDLAHKRKSLADAEAHHHKSVAAIEADEKRAAGERADAEREMSQRFVDVGTMLNLHRVDDERYRKLYSRIDELKSELNAREATIVRLESELRTYDRSALQAGLITVGVVFAVLVILAIILVVLLSR